MTAVKTFNFLNAFILQVACSVASKHHQLSVQTCCCFLLPRHEESMKRFSTLPLCFLSAALFPESSGRRLPCRNAPGSWQEMTKHKTEISFKVKVWGYCPSLGADLGLGFSSFGGSVSGQWGVLGRGARGTSSWAELYPQPAVIKCKPLQPAALEGVSRLLECWGRARSSPSLPGAVPTVGLGALPVLAVHAAALSPCRKTLALPLRPCSSERVGTGFTFLLCISGVCSWTRKPGNASDLSAQPSSGNTYLHPPGSLSVSQGCWALGTGYVLVEQSTRAHTGCSWLYQEDKETRIPSMAPNFCREAGTTGLLCFGCICNLSLAFSPGLARSKVVTMVHMQSAH